jgi:hypothetical protein
VKLVSRDLATSAALSFREGHVPSLTQQRERTRVNYRNINSGETHFLGRRFVVSVCACGWEAVIRVCWEWLSISSAPQPAGSTQQLILVLCPIQPHCHSIGPIPTFELTPASSPPKHHTNVTTTL